MITCKECKYWTTEQECTNSHMEYNAKLPQDDELYYMDYENYSAYITTGPNFGCIHGERT